VFERAAANGCKEVTFDSLCYDLDEDLAVVKRIAYEVRTALQKEQRMSLIRLWRKDEGRRHVYGLKPCDGSEEDQALFRADVLLDKQQILGRVARYDERLDCALEVKALPKKQVKHMLLPWSS